MTIERAPEFPRPVTIEQVENGYLLTFSFDTESRYPRRDPQDYERRQPRVFPSKAALFAHLAEHFTHEAVSVPMDKAPPSGPLTGDAAYLLGPKTDGSTKELQHVGGGFTDFSRNTGRRE